MENLFNDIAKGINDLYTKQQELAAIWREGSPVWLIEGGKLKRTVRLAPNQLIAVKDGCIVNVSENFQPATHQIISCWGCLTSSFELVLIELKTNHWSTLKL